MFSCNFYMGFTIPIFLMRERSVVNLKPRKAVPLLNARKRQVWDVYKGWVNKGSLSAKQRTTGSARGNLLRSYQGVFLSTVGLDRCIQPLKSRLLTLSQYRKFCRGIAGLNACEPLGRFRGIPKVYARESETLHRPVKEHHAPILFVVFHTNETLGTGPVPLREEQGD